MFKLFKKYTRKQITTYTFIALCFIVSVVFIYHNEALYDRSIAHITETTLTETTDYVDEHGNKEKLFTQDITAVIKNGAYKGETLQLENEYSSSGAYDYRYESGQDVFVSIDEDTGDNADLTGGITDIKRDKYLVLVAWIFFFTLFFVGKKQGVFATVSLALNIILLSYALDLYVHTGMNLLWICGITVILFTVISLLLVNGFNEKTYTAIIATLLGTFSSLLIAFLTMWLTGEKGLHYEEMQFLTRPYDLVFLAGLFIGSLGAVMDVAISISAAMFELYQKNRHISVKALKKSGFDIGKDIMGTMTNILFFAYVSGSIPTLILYLKNSSQFGFTLSINLSLELARALAGGIGIVITIPIGLYTCLFFINRKQAKS